jgi:serine/threonine protein kinase
VSLVPGSYVGVYEILAPLGAGGMGEVYRARDPKLRRQVAIKVLPAAFAADRDWLARFEREAPAIAALSHPNILAIHDFDRAGEITYAVMELLDGRSLGEVIAAGPIPRWKAMVCATQMAKGLEAAHARGIVHRDLKPENVFVSAACHVKILDFGLAATHAGLVTGTPGYLSPEQVRGEPADHRSDLFSFGCVLYEMLGGKRAFHGASPADTLHAILHSSPRDLSTFTTVPDALAPIVARCLEKTPAARFQSASALIGALNAANAPVARRPLIAGVFDRWMKRAAR